MFWFIIGFVIALLGVFIVLSVLRLLLYATGWIIQAIFSLFE